MQIENLPYPVYCEGSPDYFGVLFSVDMDQAEAKDPLHFAIRGRFDIQNQDIKQIIDSGYAGFGLLIECNQTDYYELRPCAEFFHEKIIKAYFSGIVTITPVIYAKKEIVHYLNDDLIDELREQDITIPEGGIIAADAELELSITRSLPQTVESICKFRPSEVQDYDIEGDSIIISIPPEVYGRYKKMTRNQKIEVTSIYFPSVLLDIIYEHFYAEGSDYKNHKWYGAINDALTARGIDPAENSPYDSMSVILGGLLSEGVGYIQLAEEVNQ